MAGILLIDDDVDLREFLKSSLASCGHYVECLDRAEPAPDHVAGGRFDLVLLDNHLPGMTGIELLAALKQRGLSVPVILMTGYSNTEANIAAWNLRAFHYVIKPSGNFANLLTELEPLILEALEIARPSDTPVRLPGEPTRDAGPALLGIGKPMQRVYRHIGQYAESQAPVLILGETGTGKELVARAVHDYSPRRNKLFLAMNCTALVENLLNDELFGHVKGAFNDAKTDRKGRFEHADGGTLFLDEVGDMPATMQEQLLRVLESKEVCRIGSNDPIKVDVRVVAATHRDLQAAVAKGAFREDLYHRLDGVTIRLPALRDRGVDDLRLLTQHYLCVAARERGRAVPLLSADAWAKLERHPWPGNVRELRNTLRRAVLKCRGARIAAADIELNSSPTSDAAAALGDSDLAGCIRRAVDVALKSGSPKIWPLMEELLKRELAESAMRATANNECRAAYQVLGIGRNTLRAVLARIRADRKA